MYKERLIDSSIQKKLKSSGGLLIKGPKGCGKTETSRYHSNSEIVIDDSPNITAAMATDPYILLNGETPRLIDEWQEQPMLWNSVRHEIDNRKKRGQFILTGSANPNDDVKLHSGVGRFSVLNMRTMTNYEKGFSTGEISLNDVMNNSIPKINQEVKIETISKNLFLGGWPGTLGMSVNNAIEYVDDYLNLLIETDINRVTGVKRNPIRIRRVIESLARNLATEVTLTAISRDVAGTDGNVSEDTIREYLNALDRVMIKEDLEVWNTHLRSSVRLRKAPKRHFADPTLALRILGITPTTLINDLEYMGFVFESMVIRDLRVYSEMNGGKVYYYRDSNKNEADAVIEYQDGSWSAFEIKLGFGAIEDGANSLKNFLKNIDTKKMGEPKSLNVITGSGFSHTRKDGINVFPIWGLRD
jgi:predicted AAA+ superfamily ATPase